MHWVVWMRILFHSISKHYRLIYSSQIHVNHYICVPHIQFIHNLSNLKPVKNQREKNGNCTVLKARSHHSHSNQNVSTSHLKKKKRNWNETSDKNNADNREKDKENGWWGVEVWGRRTEQRFARRWKINCHWQRWKWVNYNITAKTIEKDNLRAALKERSFHCKTLFWVFVCLCSCLYAILVTNFQISEMTS